MPVNDETLKPGAPGACRDGGEFDPQVRKFRNAGRESGVVLHRERIDLGDFGAVEAGDIEPEIRRSGTPAARGCQVDTTGAVFSLV